MAVHHCYLSNWLSKEPGALLVGMEREQLQRLIKPALGDHLVQIGGLPELVADCPIRFKWYFNWQAKAGSIHIALDELPLLPESVDIMVLSHVLEYVPEPMVLLRQAYQALAPGGQLIVVGLNPWSMWGLAGEAPYPRPLWQIKNNLRKLRLRMVMSGTFCFRPPLHSLTWWQRLIWMEAVGAFCCPALGGFYIIAAQKRVIRLTPLLQPAWPRKVLFNKSLKPSIRAGDFCKLEDE